MSTIEKTPSVGAATAGATEVFGESAERFQTRDNYFVTPARFLRESPARISEGYRAVRLCGDQSSRWMVRLTVT